MAGDHEKYNSGFDDVESDGEGRSPTTTSSLGMVRNHKIIETANAKTQGDNVCGRKSRISSNVQDATATEDEQDSQVMTVDQRDYNEDNISDACQQDEVEQQGHPIHETSADAYATPPITDKDDISFDEDFFEAYHRQQRQSGMQREALSGRDFFHEDQSESSAEKLRLAIIAYRAKMENGTADMKDEIHMARLQRQEMQRLHKLAQDAAIRNDDSMECDDSSSDEEMFVPDEQILLSDTTRKRACVAEHDSTVDLTSSSRPSQRRKINCIGKEVPEYPIDLADCQKSKKKSTADSRLALLTSNGSKSAKGKKNVSKTARKAITKKPNHNRVEKPLSRKEKNQMANEKRWAGNLNGRGINAGLSDNGLFRNVQSNHARNQQPGFTATKKKDAFKQLMASIPQESRSIAKMDKKQLYNASMDFTGLGSCLPDGGSEWHVKGMASSLTHYQMLGVSFMRKREGPCQDPAGGILADAMGLGKTVMAIANIVNGLRVPGRKRLPTLVVCPPSIVIQWKEEIEKHVEKSDEGVKTKKYKLKPVRTFAAWRKYMHEDHLAVEKDNYKFDVSIIIATYPEICNSYPKFNPPVTAQTQVEKEQWWARHYDETRGLAHRVHFERIFLDEGTAIKNHRSRTSQACRALMAEFRWIVSGTPVMNNLSEFYAYFKFLQVSQTGTFQVFKKNYLTADSRGTERLSMRLQSFMLRRNHSDEIFGAKLLDLPEPSKGTLLIQLTPFEKDLYRFVKTRFIDRINRFSKNGQLGLKCKNIWVMFLRLRMLNSHPLLIHDIIRDLLDPEDILQLQNLINTAHALEAKPSTLYTRLQTMVSGSTKLELLEPEITSPKLASETSDVLILEDTDADIDAIAVSTCEVSDSSVLPEPTEAPLGSASNLNIDHRTQPTNTVSSPSANGVVNSTAKRSTFASFLKTLAEDRGFIESIKRLNCVKCKKKPLQGVVTSCNHAYCKLCLEELQHRSTEEHSKCLACATEYTEVKEYDVDGDVSKQSDPSQTAGSEVKTKKKKSRQDRINELLNDKGSFIPSAKTTAIKNQVRAWLEQDREVKIIVFTQFTTMALIICRICQLENWGHVMYTGQSSPKQRDKIKKEFETDPVLNIMISNLKCGGAGLNLTMATRVIVVDPWWNSAVEDQAFCRVYRKGQLKTTILTKLIVVDTVDQAMMEMQERKEEEIDGVMADPSKAVRNYESLMKLFGPVDEDEDGNNYIYVPEIRNENGVPVLDSDDEEEDNFFGK